jgi:hypothetical protein
MELEMFEYHTHQKSYSFFLSYTEKEDIAAWFMSNGVDLGKERVNYEISYNDFHHFYDLTCFMVDSNKIKEILTREGFKFEIHTNTWCWLEPTEENMKWAATPAEFSNGRIRIPGSRFWIYPKPELDYTI